MGVIRVSSYFFAFCASLFFGSFSLQAHVDQEFSWRVRKAIICANSLLVMNWTTRQLLQQEVIGDPDGELPVWKDDPFESWLDVHFRWVKLNVFKEGAESVRAGYATFANFRELAGFPRSPPHRSVNHSFRDTGTQAFVVSYFLPWHTQRALSSALMSYLMHELDDAADNPEVSVYLTRLFSQEGMRNASELVRQILQEIDRLSKGPGSYELLYDLMMDHAAHQLPNFDRKEFDFALMMMWIGAPLYSASMEREGRGWLEDELRYLMLSRLPKKSRLAELIRRRVFSSAYLAGIVKVLGNGIRAFKEKNADFETSIWLSLLLRGGLFDANAEREVKTGELVKGDILPKGVAEQQLSLIIHEVNRLSPATLKEILPTTVAYVNGFEGVLRKNGTYSRYLSFLMRNSHYLSPRRFRVQLLQTEALRYFEKKRHYSESQQLRAQDSD